MKTCAKCKTTYPLSEFYTDKRRKDKKQSWCKTCHSVRCRQDYHKRGRQYATQQKKQWLIDNPTKARTYWLKGTYNITDDEYDQLLKKQNGACAICRKACERYKYLSVDHCHKTKRVRGLLCNKCNIGLGQFQDNVDTLKEAIKYLNETH